MNLHDRDNFRRGLKEGIEQGISQGAQQKAIETAKNALKMDLPIKQISTLTGLSIEEIQALAK